MSTKVKVEYYGVEGEGRNVTAAKQDAGHKIQKMLGGSYAPMYITSDKQTAVVFRDPRNGWGYFLIHTDDPECLYPCICSSGHEDKKAAAYAAKSHLLGLRIYSSAIELYEACREINHLDHVDDLVRSTATQLTIRDHPDLWNGGPECIPAFRAFEQLKFEWLQDEMKRVRAAVAA